MRLFVFLAILLFGLPSFAKVVDYIAAVVNGEPILYSEVVEYAKENRIRDLRAARDSLIERKILLTEAKAEGITVSDKEIEAAVEDFIKRNGFRSIEEFEEALKKEGLTIEDVKEKLREQMLVARLISRSVKSKIKVTDIDVEKYCRKLQEKPVREVYYIFTRNRAIAEKAMEALNAGVPFEKVAKEYSEDKATAEKGGYIGVVAKGSLIKPLDYAVWSTEPGKYRLVQSKEGYFIIYVKSEEKKSCDRERIRQQLYTERFQRALKDYIDSLKKKASVKVYM